MMTYDEAAKLYKERWLLGKKHGDGQFPYDIRYEDDHFIQVTVPCVVCKTQETDVARVNKYINELIEGVDLGASWVAYGKRLKNGDVIPFQHRRLFVLDGNHRIEAKIAIGKYYTEVFIPKSNYDLYLREAHGE